MLSTGWCLILKGEILMRRAFPAVFLLMFAGACSFFFDDPTETAEAFWLASQKGDVERARDLVLPSGSAEIKEPGESGTGIGDFSLGDAEVDGDEAKVSTTLYGLGENDMEISFSTVLAKEDGEWLVDLDRTTSEMTRALFGTTLQEMAEGMGRAMGEAVGDVVEGVAEGLQAAGESLAAGVQRRNKNR